MAQANHTPHLAFMCVYGICICIFFIQPQTFWFQCSSNKLCLKLVNEISRCITSGAPRFGGGVLHPPSNVICLHGRLPHPHVWILGHKFHDLITTEKGTSLMQPGDRQSKWPAEPHLSYFICLLNVCFASCLNFLLNLKREFFFSLTSISYQSNIERRN